MARAWGRSSGSFQRLFIVNPHVDLARYSHSNILLVPRSPWIAMIDRNTPRVMGCFLAELPVFSRN